jgi:hypothetical protein
LRLFIAISLFAALAAALVACGGGGGGGGGEDPNKVLDQTFGAGHQAVKSADLSLKLSVSATGSQGGSFTASVSGPFESEGKGKVPKLDIDVTANGSGNGQNISFDGGLISTGDAAYVSYKGTDYQVSPALFAQYKQLLQQTASQQQGNQSTPGQLLKQLGIENPKDLLTNLKNDGTADVEGTTTDHISGDLDVGKLVDSLKNALSGASALGALGGNTSQLPSPAQLDQVKGAIKTAHFDLYSGQDDHTLRRLTLQISVEPPSGTTKKLDLSFDLTLGKVNESQTISAPTNAKPFAQLLRQFGISPSQLGSLGSLGAVPGTGISGQGTPSSPPSGAPSAANAQQAQKYLQCISKASTAADLQKCQALAP